MDLLSSSRGKAEALHTNFDVALALILMRNITILFVVLFLSGIFTVGARINIGLQIH